MWRLVILIGIAFATTAKAETVAIVVDHGDFTSVEEAASGEKEVNFWDADLTDDNACTECFAAMELKKFLLKVTHFQESDIRFAPPSKMPASGDVFILGNHASNPLTTKLGQDKANEFTSSESFNIRTINNSTQTITIIQGDGRVGTLYGVYTYLNELGIHFFGLGEQGTLYPKNKVSPLKDINITQNPDYLTRGFWISNELKHDPNDMHLWMARNKLNHWTMLDRQVHKIKKLGLILCIGEHTSQLFFINPKHDQRVLPPSGKSDRQSQSVQTFHHSRRRPPILFNPKLGPASHPERETDLLG
jgi:hypothetical protein